MNSNVKNEEVTVLGDFVLTSYTRDFNVIKSKFIKLDEGFKDGFIVKLASVKELESSLVLTEAQKGVTASLYAEAGLLNGELNFLSSHFADADLNSGIVTAVKNDLFSGNIEGAILKLEGLKQFVATHEVALVAQGMVAGYSSVIGEYKVSLTAKNNSQNEIINNRKQLTGANSADYEVLLKIIRQITNKGKLVFKGTVYQDEYTVSKILQRMRAAKKKDGVGGE
jgi:hypothetical protein